jgi:hypothetical protein
MRLGSAPCELVARPGEDRAADEHHSGQALRVALITLDDSATPLLVQLERQRDGDGISAA